MLTDDVVEEKAKQIGQKMGNAYFTRLTDVYVSSSIDTSYRKV